MSTWPEFHTERLAGSLLRVDMLEQRHLDAGEWHHAVDLLLKTAAAACLLDREADALVFVHRAASRTEEWITAVGARQAPLKSYDEYGAARGILAIGIAGGGEAALTRFVAQSALSPAGGAHNARIGALLLLNRLDALPRAVQQASPGDPGLGAPWRRFALAVAAGDAATALRQAEAWIQEKRDATMTSEWGAYNEVPIEVSGALAAAEHAGLPLRMASNRILTRWRAD